MEGLLVALISGGVTLSVCLINNYYQSNATRKLLEYRLSELERKVDKHNMNEKAKNDILMKRGNQNEE